MADNKVEEVKVQDVHVDPVERARGFWDKNKKLITGVLAAVVLVLVGWLVYKSMFKEPAENRAAEAIFKAEEYFRADSLKLALLGDGQNKGFVYIAKNYGGTKAGNLANFYAGVCYLKTGDFNNAVKYLKDFSTSSKQIQMLAYGKLGDAYSELGKKEDAVDNYKKAGTHFKEDEFNSSEFLFRAGYLLESMGKTNEALEVYRDLKENYPKTEKGYSIDKYIYRLSVEKNEFSVK
ncbi:tetratricopeptide repeat protein [Segetibacter sp. 3557_3]|uniref:tetratricopeptide repeat protein n=1 Tax=Segetibacter sp. 3557_3 TaxID=2547429 RepID=UPI0010585F5D|nr:tetratricopeptide repeat protein [Segetibacter sp. 3557_3]TDH29158.1 tetratricopeptide repeat protein [Segetibacter sp. 3557_3]